MATKRIMVKWACGHSRKSLAKDSEMRRFEILDSASILCPECQMELQNDCPFIENPETDRLNNLYFRLYIASKSRF